MYTILSTWSDPGHVCVILVLEDDLSSYLKFYLITDLRFCAFGVSKHDFKDPDLFPGALQILYNSRRCNTIFSSTRDRTFWFLIQKNDKRYTYPNIPRYATSKAEGIMERLIEDMYVSENTSMRDVWEKRTKFAMTSLEEVVLKRWWEGRVCLVGDSAHKVSLPFFISVSELFSYAI